MGTKTRLNMEHGFMQSIIKNQLDRDNYDKEVKAKEGKKMVTQSHVTSKTKKPDQHTYAPPMMRSQDANNKTSAEKTYLFTFEYEDENGKLFHLVVNEGDDVANLAKQFGQERNLEMPLINALSKFLLEQVEKYAIKQNS